MAKPGKGLVETPVLGCLWGRRISKTCPNDMESQQRHEKLIFWCHLVSKLPEAGASGRRSPASGEPTLPCLAWQGCNVNFAHVDPSASYLPPLSLSVPSKMSTY